MNTNFLDDYFKACEQIEEYQSQLDAAEEFAFGLRNSYLDDWKSLPQWTLLYCTIEGKTRILAEGINFEEGIRLAEENALEPIRDKGEYGGILTHKLVPEKTRLGDLVRWYFELKLVRQSTS